jgi:hypothetical protein
MLKSEATLMLGKGLSKLVFLVELRYQIESMKALGGVILVLWGLSGDSASAARIACSDLVNPQVFQSKRFRVLGDEEAKSLIPDGALGYFAFQAEYSFAGQPPDVPEKPRVERLKEHRSTGWFVYGTLASLALATLPLYSPIDLPLWVDSIAAYGGYSATVVMSGMLAYRHARDVIPYFLPKRNSSPGPALLKSGKSRAIVHAILLGNRDLKVGDSRRLQIDAPELEAGDAELTRLLKQNVYQLWVDHFGEGVLSLRMVFERVSRNKLRVTVAIVQEKDA